MYELDGHSLTTDAVWRVAVEKQSCALPERARESMRASRDFVEKAASSQRAIYGINTGFGPLSGCRVSEDDLMLHQMNLLAHLSVGQGKLFSPQETRAIMVARANALARGFSGIREEVVDLLVQAINRDVLPEIPSEGSVGASGDLVPLAHMARFLTGQGHIRHRGERKTAAEGLSLLGSKPVVLRCKEGLALVNGTSTMTGLAALSVKEAGILLSWCELLSAGLFQVLSAAPEALCGMAHKARGFRGQYAVAERIANHLKAHEGYRREIEENMWGTHAKPVDPGIEIQDPYSVRCTPQILGAFQDALWHIDQMVTCELNASTDNPLIFPAEGAIVHNGNFYGQHVSMASDYLRLGLATLALLLDRQLERLVNWRTNYGLPPLLAGGAPGLNSGLMGCQLLATSLAAECRLLSAPASVQTIPTNANNQDMVSMGCTSAKMTRELTDKLWTLASIQALALAQAAELRGSDALKGCMGELHAMIRTVSDVLGADRALYEDIARIRELLCDPVRWDSLLPPRPSCASEPQWIS